MTNRESRLQHLLIFAATCVVPLFASRSQGAPPEGPLNFEQHVRPILKAYCFDCHGAGEKVKGKLDLRLKHFMAKGGASGPVIVAGQPKKSLLLERLQSGEMPPGEIKVPKDKIAIVEKWLADGARALRAEPDQLPLGFDITPDERAYWFYQPLVRPEPPKFTSGDRVHTPVDAFVLARLRERKLSFNPDADPLTLIRRASLDLIGLPPTPKEIDDFRADRSDQAYEKLLDRLLASPHYGERWARHWLDVAGYADSDGDGTNDTVRPHAWRYRDYVIRALNADKPFDRFIVEQLAGDELVHLPWTNLKADQIELLTATGFLRTAPNPTTSSNGPAQAEQVVSDTLKIVSSSLLGLTVGCAQCHDHKYDPIPQADYYRMRAIFEPALNPAQWRHTTARRVTLYTDADRARAAAIDVEAAKMQAAFSEKQQKYVKAAFDKELGKYPADQRDRLRAAFATALGQRTDEHKVLVAANPKLNISPGILYQYDQPAADELKKLLKTIDAKRAEKPVEHFVDVTSEVPGQVPTTRILHRGDYRQPKGDVLPGDLSIAAPSGKRLEIAAKDAKTPTTGRRLAFAKHLTSGAHPLFGRALVNRLWLHHFGQGIVDTPGDFGMLGQRPTHPELLDWLATEFASQGWSLKRMHKLLMTSTVYRQSSQRNAAQDVVDSSNALYGRFAVRRLDAEALRDRMLATSGRLNRAAFGPPIPVLEDAAGQPIVPDDQPRRSIYLQVRRSKPLAFLAAFDAPSGELNCDRRQASTGAPQALMLMNSDFALQQASHLAKRLRAETSPMFALKQLAPIITKYRHPTEAWQYGFGAYDPKSKKISAFTPLPHWTGTTWQGGPKLPDPKIGWAIVHAVGGHAGDDQAHASVRRWLAPRDGVVTIAGKLKHGSPNGDGVRGRIVSSRHGLLAEWTVKNKGVVATVKDFEVKAGDTIDFAVDCVESVTSDSYEWGVNLTLTTPTGSSTIWNSARDFRGPAPVTLVQQVAFAWQTVYQRSASSDELDLACRFLVRQMEHLAANPDPELAALTNLCQQLLSSNEFLYVD